MSENTTYMPLFPLQVVVFPGEKLNLHIVEERYKQLVHECIEKQSPFGVVPVINSHLQEYGTTVTLISIEKTYDNGEMDICTLGGRLFRVLEFMETAAHALYPAGVITYSHPYTVGIDNDNGYASPEILNHLKELLAELLAVLHIDPNIIPSDERYISYRIAHYLNMPLPMEYDLLLVPSENMRQQMVTRFLEEIIPDISRREEVRKKISLNGHFKNLQPPNF